MTSSEWHNQLLSDKELWDQSKEYSRGTTVGDLRGYYGKNYHESLAGYRRALKREGKKIPKKYQEKKRW